ncbi:putative RNA 2'-phosphotransferase [Nakamurella sp. UYEF19]|uniref:RNA 2'-phosphotransferase n=1 Tax=Nakamurella sp. UYEF19 TaxID=1756392 RepID=UPI00339B923B
MDDSGLKQLSRMASHALRHDPSAYGLEPDPEGWVPIEALLRAARARGGQLAEATTEDLIDMIAKADKERHQMQGGSIRALYGHSLAGKIPKAVGEPPEILFHGTSARAWRIIQTEGLKPMGRQYVHLSVDREMAEQVGRRKGPELVVIAVAAVAAGRRGIVFRLGNDRVWLADPIAPEFLTI